MLRFLTASLLPALLLAAGRAHAGISDEVEFFEKQVRPVLAQHCYKCHGPEKQKADLRLDSRTAILKGSDAGAVVVPGNPEESLLIKSIRHDGDVKMPEKDEKLDDDQIAALTEWVKAGLPWPASDASKQTVQETAARTHWAFQRVQTPAVPEVRDPHGWAQSEIDRFVLARLEKEGLTPSPRSSRRTLIRRASLDLTGLPPSHAEVESFENDASSDAFAKLVERLLASPHYGERWGRYWLDVARYADTKGYVFQEERRYPFAFTYRDWVIRAFNDDMPYDKFLVRQIAADHLNEGPDSMAALGFLTLGRRFINNIHDIIDDRIDVVSRGTMALTTTCARCHDHKFDPITQSDYYALYGVFASSTEPELKDLPLLPGHVPSPEYVAERAKREGVINDYYAQRATELTTIVSVLLQQPAFFAPEIVPVLFESRFFTRKARDELRELRNKLTRVEVSFNGPARAMALVDKAAPVKPRIFLRGSPDRPGPEVPRRFIAVLAGPNPPAFEKGSGRLELARAIADPANPLTARVIVNRVWAHHFGAGLVRTPSDFGVKGESPTHPELLDWMASRFVADGWSLKKLHRMIMLSSSYQQSSDASPELFQRDPENRLLARMNRRRLDYEALRDSLLAVTGTLDRTIGGRPVDITSADSPKRRTVYAFIDRQNLPGVFRTFDFASPDATSPQRYVTTVPQQALFMLNSPFLFQQARALVAAPPARESERDEEAIQRLYRAVLARDAHPDELLAGLAFLEAQKSRTLHADETPLWAYGFGKYDENVRKVTFQTLPHWTGYAWQGSKELPDAKVGWVLVSRDGGHPGGSAEHCAIRRWSAPRTGTISITGTISRPSKDGDGVIASVVSSRRGELKRITVAPGATVEAEIEQLDVEHGETIDFIVAAGGNETSDTFSWSAIIRGANEEWNAQLAFSGPRPERPAPLSPWEKYAQVLLATNEFAFVD